MLLNQNALHLRVSECAGMAREFATGLRIDLAPIG
jgi:hypothetical protein